jgi:transposase
MVKKYIVRLNAQERNELESLVNKGRVAAHKRRHAEILLKADQGGDGPAWNDGKIADAFNLGRCTVERVRKRLVEEGMEAALNERQKSRHRRKKMDGENEARLVALACSEPPDGRRRWTMELLADRMVELEYVESLSAEAVRQTLKKTNLSLG